MKVHSFPKNTQKTDLSDKIHLTLRLKGILNSKTKLYNLMPSNKIVSISVFKWYSYVTCATCRCSEPPLFQQPCLAMNSNIHFTQSFLKRLTVL